MPQPLSNSITKESPYNLAFNADELRTRPLLAAKVSEFIARASALDHGMAMVLVSLLHASPEPAFAMFSEVLDAGNRRAMILAAARSTLDAEHFEMLEVVSNAVRMQIDVRNKFAHWLWGGCEQLPDALLLVDPRYLLGHARHFQKVWTDDPLVEQDVERAHEERMAAIRFDFDKIYVYRATDLDQSLRDMTETQGMLDDFGYMFNPQARSLDERMSDAFPNSPRESFLKLAKDRLINRVMFIDGLTRLRTKRGRNSASAG
ncbi:hypothetical protein ACIQUB_07920 [Rhizobium sp. NPDC090275]|uniref:hypothetical protein n=1 Tax=Rhizobium sp. NPDC090275 TaxID=3364498 RepID=UPI000DDC9642